MHFGFPRALPALALTLLSPVASAQATLAAGGTPVVLASELQAPVTLDNASGAFDLRIPLGYAFSGGEVRYVRVDCDPALAFAPAATVVYQDGGGAAGSAAIGALNGAGTSALRFSVTATTTGVGDHPGDRFVIDGDRDLSESGRVACRYAVYDSPSDAARGGTDGRIVGVEGPYLDSEPALELRVDAAGATEAVANVDAFPRPFSRFDAAVNPLGSTGVVRLGRIRFGERAGLQLDSHGVDAGLAAVLDAGSVISISGDFSAARDDDEGYAGATARVFLGNASCAAPTAAVSVSETEAAFDAAITDAWLCYAPNVAWDIPASDYSASLAAVSLPGFDATSSTLSLGPITRNGAELQVPMVELPPNALVRIALTNTTDEPRGYSVRLLGFDGAAPAVDGDPIEGKIPAQGGLVVNLHDRIVGLDPGARRFGLTVSVSGPNRGVQGQLQIVDPASGVVSNLVMVRPGSN